MKIKLTLGYDGTRYSGWQIQKNGNTVQEELEKALHALTGENIRVTGSGRTDAGVHAEGQVVSFETFSSIPADKFAPALNGILPADIRVSSSKKVNDGFNARFSAKQKTYVYRMYVSDTEIPVKERFAVRVDGLDLPLVKTACKIIEGEHDFIGFSATGSDVKDTVRKIYSITAVKHDGFVTVRITGNGFLYKMVRLIVGALVAVSDKKLTLSELEEIFISKKRPNAVKAMPAKGLTLYKVQYPKSIIV